jgi:hypothetical protein
LNGLEGGNGGSGHGWFGLLGCVGLVSFLAPLPLQFFFEFDTMWAGGRGSREPSLTKGGGRGGTPS